MYTCVRNSFIKMQVKQKKRKYSMKHPEEGMTNRDTGNIQLTRPTVSTRVMLTSTSPITTCTGCRVRWSNSATEWFLISSDIVLPSVSHFCIIIKCHIYSSHDTLTHPLGNGGLSFLGEVFWTMTPECSSIARKPLYPYIYICLSFSHLFPIYI